MNTSYYFHTPALLFEEAFPIGNGTNGAMIYGRTETEKITLNNDTLYAGGPEKQLAKDDAYKTWERAREAVMNGDPCKSAEILETEFNLRGGQPYLPLGQLRIDLNHNNPANYRRELDLTTGIVTIDYDHNGTHYTRTCFVSTAKDCVVLRFTADQKSALSMTIRFDSEHRCIHRFADNGSLVYCGACPGGRDEANSTKVANAFFSAENDGDSIHFAEYLKPVVSGGISYIADDTIVVENADEVILYACCRNTYIDPYTPPIGDCLVTVKAAAAACEDYPAILKEHIDDFSALFSRVSLSLTEKEDPRDILTRLQTFDGSDLGLIELLFNFGRYLTISASRPGSKPMNLQGIWNEKMTPPWGSSYTMNINLEMNYWPTMVCNLGECFEPLVSFVKNCVQSGRETARRMHNARGFAMNPNCDVWAHTIPLGNGRRGTTPWSPWPHVGGWFADQLYDGYEYTLNKDYLADIYPIMKEASLFYVDTLTEYNGKLIFSPGMSPENRYMLDETESTAVAKYSAVQQQIISELFLHTAEAARILDTDAEFAAELDEKRKTLQGPQIGKDGRLLEWDDTYPERELQHRHCSHLYGLYPGTTISIDQTPELAEACRQSLLVRGDDGTGWSLAWKINFWALLREGDHAETLIRNQLRLIDMNPTTNSLRFNGGGTYPNLFDAHPPFQIDGNFGATAGIANMLLHSRIGKILLLPALPSAWKNGSFSGLCAKGGVTVSTVWEDGKVVHAEFCSANPQTITVSANGTEYPITLTSNVPVCLDLR